MILSEYLEKYKKHELSDSDAIIPMTFYHLTNQLKNYDTFREKYDINFDFLAATASYVLNEITQENNLELAKKIYRLYIKNKKEF